MNVPRHPIRNCITAASSRRAWCGGILVAAAAIGLAVPAAANAGTSAKTPLTSVTSVTFVGSAGFFTDDVAREEGFFKKEGLDVRFLQVSSGAQYLQLLVSGSIQGGITDLGPALTAIGKGADIKVIGSTLNRNVFELSIAKGQTWADGLTGWREIMRSLIGKHVGVSGLGAATDISLRGLLFAAGIKPSEVRIIGIGTETAAATQLRAGTVQAAVEEFSNEPYFVETGAARPLLKFATVPVPTVSNVSIGLIFNGHWYAAHQAVAARWLRAEELAEHWAEDPANTEKAAALMASWVKVDQKAGLANLIAIRKLYEATPADFHVPRENIENELTLLNQAGILPRSQNPSYDSFVVTPKPAN